MIKIYDINDKLLMQAEVTSAAKREQEMSKSDYITLSFSAAEKVILPVGAYINYTYKIDKVREVTRKFLLLESYEPIQTDECSWKYTPQFQHPKMILSKTPFFIYTRNSQNVEVKQNVWSFVGTTSALSGKIADFLNKDLMFGECGWKVIFSNVTANTVNVSFSDNDFISALTAITNAIGDNCEWHIDYDDEFIYIGKVLVGATPVVLEVGKNVGVPNISNSKESYYNAFSIFGGTRNITQVNSKGENVSSGDIRLQLDEGNGTISIDGKERSYSIDKYSTLDLRVDKINEPLFTKVLDFSQIFPSLNTYVYNVRGRVKYVFDENNEKIPISYNADGSIKEYKTFTVWYMRLAYPTTEKVEGKTIINTTVDNGVTHYWYDFQITDNLLINGKNIGCSFEANFNTGALSTPLAGRGSNGEYVGFELTYHKEASSSHTSDDVSASNFSILAGDYEIIYQEDNEVIIPTNAADMLIPRGESMPSLKCNITVLYNIAMSDSIYYEDAQNRLLQKAKEGIVRLLSDLNNYEIKSYSDVFLEENPELQIGQSVTYKDGHGYELATRVLKLSTNIDFDFIQTITLGNQVIKGTITQLKEDVQTIIASGGSSGNGGGYSVSQLRNLIAKYGSDNFLSKQFDDTAHGTITWEKIQKLLSGFLVGNFNSENGGSWTPDTEGRSHLITDYLEVRMKAIFEELVIKKTSTIGGKEILSPAGGVVAHKVEEVTVTYNNVSQKAYRCYFLAEQEGDSVDNDFAIGDQVRSESFNVRKGTYHKVGNHFYWRLVIGRDEDPVELEGKKYHYIDLSDTDCATASDVPAKGDVLSQCGNRTDVERQNCLIFSAVDTYSPSVSLYHGINSYSFANKEYVEYGVNKQTNKAFFNVYGDMYVGDRPTKENGYEGSSYIKYDSAAKQVSVKGKISAKSTVDGKELSQYIKDNSAGGLTEEQVNNLIKNSQVIADLQNQVDGAIETWFYEGVPTLKNAPASSWTTDKEKDTHLGDLYYDNKTGKAYRFAKDGSTYKWTVITDTDIAKALSDAAKAQETADGKMKVFSTQPIPPYQLGDIWVNATYPTDGSIYKNEILRCQTTKAKGSSFAIADWTKASKYTDDSALNTFKEKYKNDMASYKEQLDEKVETWFYNYAPTTQNKPASDWTTDTLKSQHAGDLFYNTSNGYTYRWTGTAWARIKDNDINTAMTAASKAQDTADGKRTVFTSQPTVPYDEGDLWASGGDDGKTLMVCVKNRDTGSFTSSEWVKANDSDLNAFAKTIEESLNGIRDQLDKKAETWYQSTDPSASWTTDDAKKEHKGDLWYNTSNNQTFFWNGAKWDKQDVPTEVFDKIDGKSSIYVSKPASYEERDLWILEAAYTLGGVAYSKGELVVATKTNASFSAADWTKKVKYTDDTVANAAKKAAEEAKKAADTAQTNVTNLGKTVTSNKKAFDNYVTDGYLEPSEIAAMAQDSKRLEDAFAAAEKSYTEVKEAAVLKDTKELTDLNTAFVTLSTAKTELIKYLSDISARYNAANTEGKATIVSAVGTKFTNFQSAYSAFYDKLGLANAYITSKIYGDLKQNITDLAGYKYIKDALGQTTDIDGGLVMTTLLALRDADGNVQSGINGAIDPNRGKKSIATWWGGRMVDKDYNSGNLTPATSLVRFDGSGYLANGAIWWDVDGKVHADPTSFIISEKNLGAYLTFFEPTWKSGSAGTSVADLVSLKPNAPFSKLGVSGDATFEGVITFHGIKLTYDATNKAIKIDGNLYATGGITAYGAGTSTSGGGGLNGSVKSYADALKLTSESLSEVASAYSIKALSRRIDNIATELGGLSLSWDNITGKPSTFAPSAHTHKWAEITDRITKVSQLTNDSGYTKNTGTVTSVSLTLPAGLTCATKTITTSGTFAISLASGYSIPTTAKQTAWDSAYDWYALMTTDEETADDIINKWNEVVSFLANIAQTDTLSGIVDGINKSISDEVARAKKAEGVNASGISANKGSIATLQGYFTNGSAKKALQLTNARKLWGNSFNGTADINGSIIVPSGKYISIGNIKLEYDAANKALKITNTTTEEVANLYTSGGVSAYGAGTSSSSGGGGLNGSVKAYNDALKLTSESLSEVASAYSIKALSRRIDNIATELGGLSLSWDNITGKPSTFAPSAHTHKWAEITDRITKVSQLTNDSGYTKNTGTVTSVSLTLPAGLTCATKTITTSGTFAISLASGYSIPTTAKQTAWDGAVSAKHTHSNKSVLDGISSTKVSHWNSAYDWYALMTTDEETADGIINKWNEVVSFLANIAQTDTLSGIVDGINKSISDEVARAKKAEGVNASGISANKGSIATLQGYFTNGSAKKALQLTNARKLWGNSFNGTADINGSIIVPSGKYISIGNIKLEYDAANKALKITNTTTEEVANLYTSGGVSAYGVGASSSSGGGLNGSVKAYADAIRLTTENLSEIASAYSVAKLYSEIQNLASAVPSISVSVPTGGNALTGATYDASTGTITFTKGTFLTAHQSLDGYVNAIAVSGSGNAVTAVTKSGKTITFTKGATYLTSHQSLSNYYTKSSVDSLLNGKSATTHTHSVKINGVTKTIAATGGTAVDLGTYLTSHQSLAGYATQSWVNSKGYITSSGSCAYATSAGNADTVDGEHASAFTRIVGRHTFLTSGTAPYNYIHLFRIANSDGYSTLDCEIDIRTRYHSAKIEIRISTAEHPYNNGGSSISIVKKVVSGRTCNLWFLPTVQSSNYNYYDVYYESGAWNSGSYGITLKGTNGTLVFEHKGTKLTSLPDKVSPVTDNVAASATKLQTARKLWGNSFNGTSDVNGSIIVPSGKYISIGNIKMEYDATNKALKITNTTTNEVANLYTSGGVSAYGVGTSSSSGGGLNGSVKSYSDALKLTSESLSEIASAYSIKALASRISSLEGGSATSISVSGSGNAVTSVTKNGTTISVVKGSTFSLSGHTHKWADITDRPSSLKNPSALSWSGYSSGSYDGSAAKSISIPNNTNQLTNGAGFITASASITGNAATATKVNHSLSVFGKSFNGSADVTVADTDLIASISTATANLTDKTEILTSYASDNGFNDSNSKNRIYRRPASAIWGYINSKTISNADKLDNVHLNGIFTALSNTNNGVSMTIGTVAKSLANMQVYSATKLVTARNIALNGDLMGNANFDGSANITINGYMSYCNATVSNTNTYPWRRIAKVNELTGNYSDGCILLYISEGFNGGYYGIARVYIRTDNLSTGANASCSIQWISRNGYGLDSLKIAMYKTTGKAYYDVFLKMRGVYASVVIRTLQDQRGGLGKRFTLVNSTETTNAASHTEAYATIEDAATAIHNQAYTSIAQGSDVATVHNADMVDGIHASGLFTNLSNSGNSLSITVGGTNKKLTVNYASNAGNADTLDGVHASGLFTNLSNSGNNISITIGGTNKTLTVGYATKAAQLNTARTLWGQSFDGTGNVNGTLINTNSAGSETIIRCSNTNGQIDLLTSVNRGVYDRTKTRWLIGTNGANSWLDCGNVGIGTNAPAYKLDVSGDARATNFRGALVGNAATATKLQTARTIWGQSFNGTANVSGSITGVNNITMSNNSYLYGKNTGGTAIQLIAMASWNSVDIGRGALVYGYTTQVMGKTVALTASDDSGKNTKSVELSTAKLYSNVNIETEGGLLAHGGVTAYSSSDIRLKQDLRKLDYFGIIKAMGGTFGFAWKKDNTRSIGWIAQHVLCNPHLKDIVETDEKGYYKINYWSPKLIATAFGAIEQVGDEVSRLKARVVFLESEVQRLSGKQGSSNKKRLDNKNINLLN